MHSPGTSLSQPHGIQLARTLSLSFDRAISLVGVKQKRIEQVYIKTWERSPDVCTGQAEQMLKFRGLERQAAVLLRIANSPDSNMSAGGFSESLQRNLLASGFLLLVQTLPDWRLLEGFYFGAIPTHQIFLEFGSFLSWDCASFKMLPAKQTRWCLRAPTHPTCSLDKFLKRSFRHEAALSPTHHHRIQLGIDFQDTDCSKK